MSFFVVRFPAQKPPYRPYLESTVGLKQTACGCCCEILFTSDPYFSRKSLEITWPLQIKPVFLPQLSLQICRTEKPTQNLNVRSPSVNNFQGSLPKIPRSCPGSQLPRDKAGSFQRMSQAGHLATWMGDELDSGSWYVNYGFPWDWYGGLSTKIGGFYPQNGCS